MSEGFTVLLANADEDELRELAELVEQAGHEVVALAITSGQTAEAIIEHSPDMAMILIEDGEEDHAMGLFAEIRGFAEIPLVVLARDVGDDTLQRAAEVSLEVLHLPGRPETIDSVIELAVSRHRERLEMEGRLGDLDSILERRSTIEQAKGILMERHGIEANEAFMRMRDHARSEQLRVIDVAQSIVTARELLPGEAVPA